MFPDPSSRCPVIPSPRPFMPLPCNSASTIDMYKAKLAADAIKKEKEACSANKPVVYVSNQTKSSSQLTMEKMMAAASAHTRIGTGKAVPFSEVIIRDAGAVLCGRCGTKSMPVDEKVCDCKGRLYWGS